MSAGLKRLNLVLRVLMELGIIGALAYWGYQTGKSATARFLLSIAAPLIGFGFWGLVDFRGAGSMAEALRLIQELVISGLAAVALYVAGQEVLGWSLAGISIVHHALVYLLGERLLKDQVHGNF